MNLLPEAIARFFKSGPISVKSSDTISPADLGINAVPSPAFFLSSGDRTLILAPSAKLSKRVSISFAEPPANLKGVIPTPLEPNLVVNFRPNWFIKTSVSLAC